MNALDIQAQGSIGMMLAGFGIFEMAKGPSRNPLIGISTAFGSVVMLSSFYQTHKFKKEDGQYNYSNIAMVSFVALSLLGLNIVYANPYVPPDFCQTSPSHPICQSAEL